MGICIFCGKNAGFLRNKHKECAIQSADARTHAIPHGENVAYEQPIPTSAQIIDWRQYPAHFLLLSKFLNGSCPDYYFSDDNWKSVLRELPKVSIERFNQEKLLEKASLEVLLDHKYKVAELKSLLKASALKLSGVKGELIQRLIDHDTQAMHEATKDMYILQCTDPAKTLVTEYISEENAKRVTALKESFSLLEREEFKQAISVVEKYELTQVFGRFRDGRMSAMDSLTAIFNSRPLILQGMEERRLRPIRLAAGMVELWGENSPSPWLPVNFETGIHLNPISVCHMFTAYIAHLRDMNDYKKLSAELNSRFLVEIISAREDSCPHCRMLDGKKYRLESMPELPYSKCTDEYGCKCTSAIVS